MGRQPPPRAGDGTQESWLTGGGGQGAHPRKATLLLWHLPPWQCEQRRTPPCPGRGLLPSNGGARSVGKSTLPPPQHILTHGCPDTLTGAWSPPHQGGKLGRAAGTQEVTPNETGSGQSHLAQRRETARGAQEVGPNETGSEPGQGGRAWIIFRSADPPGTGSRCQRGGASTQKRKLALAKQEVKAANRKRHPQEADFPKTGSRYC